MDLWVKDKVEMSFEENFELREMLKTLEILSSEHFNFHPQSIQMSYNNPTNSFYSKILKAKRKSFNFLLFQKKDMKKNENNFSFIPSNHLRFIQIVFKDLFTRYGHKKSSSI